jgi:lysosomal Pro-X carboxypeptidase
MYGASVDTVYALRHVSNIIYSNGSLDPWQSGAVLQNATDMSIISILIDGGAHHLDLREPDPADPQSVIDARDFEIETLKGWLAATKEMREKNPVLTKETMLNFLSK